MRSPCQLSTLAGWAAPAGSGVQPVPHQGGGPVASRELILPRSGCRGPPGDPPPPGFRKPQPKEPRSGGLLTCGSEPRPQ